MTTTNNIKVKLLNNNNKKPLVKEFYYTNGLLQGYKSHSQPCPSLPDRFIIAQNWMTLKRSFAILKPPKDLTIKNYKHVNDANFINESYNNSTNHVRRLHGAVFNHGNKENLIGHYYTKGLSLRGMFGFPRVRLWYKPRSSKGRIAGEATSIGSWAPAKFTDYRFIFECGSDIYFISEKKSGFFGDWYKHQTFEDSKMIMEIYKFNKKDIGKFGKYEFIPDRFPKEVRKQFKIANVKIFRMAKNHPNGTTFIETTIKFYDTSGMLMKGTAIKRITNIYQDWKSGLRSKFLVENKSNMPGFLIGFFAYIYAWKEFHDSGKNKNAM